MDADGQCNSAGVIGRSSDQREGPATHAALILTCPYFVSRSSNGGLARGPAAGRGGAPGLRQHRPLEDRDEQLPASQIHSTAAALLSLELGLCEGRLQELRSPAAHQADERPDQGAGAAEPGRSSGTADAELERLEVSARHFRPLSLILAASGLLLDGSSIPH